MVVDAAIGRENGQEFDWESLREFPASQEKFPSTLQMDPELPEEEDSEFDWESHKPIEEESTIKSMFRWLWQPMSGYVSMTPPALLADAWQAWGTGEALSEWEDLEERLPELKKKFPHAPWPEKMDREWMDETKSKYMDAVDAASGYVPTVHNVEREVESATGLPLEARTRGQRLARLGGSAGKITPGGVGTKARGALAAPGVSAGLEAAGVPEGVADLAGLITATPLAVATSDLSSEIKNAIPKRTTPQQLESDIVGGGGGGGGLPPTPFGTAEEIAQSLSAEENAAVDALIARTKAETPSSGALAEDIKPSFPDPRATKQMRRVGEGRSVTARGEDLGIRPAPAARQATPDNLKDRIGRQISPNEVHDADLAGRNLKDISMEINDGEYDHVNRLYRESDSLQEVIEWEHDVLVDDLLRENRELGTAPSPSSPEAAAIRTNNEVIDALTTRDSEGAITGFRPTTSNVITAQIKANRKKIDFDFAQGNKPTNVFKRSTDRMHEAVLRAAEGNNAPEAVNALMDANASYSLWSDRFKNKYMDPYRQLSNRDYKKLWNRNLDTDNFNVMRDIIGDHPEGSQLMREAQREIVENTMAPVIKDPRNIRASELEKAYRELEVVSTPSQINNIRQEVDATVKRFPSKARILKGESPVEVDVKAMQKYTGRPAEDIEKMMTSRSGIKELKADLSITPAGQKQFDKFSKQKVQSILRENKVQADYTGDDLFKVMNNQKNYDLISELTSPQEAGELLVASKKIADRKFTSENVKKMAKSLMKLKIFKMIPFI